jgi:hypothetical protein
VARQSPGPYRPHRGGQVNGPTSEYHCWDWVAGKFPEGEIVDMWWEKTPTKWARWVAVEWHGRIATVAVIVIVLPQPKEVLTQCPA